MDSSTLASTLPELSTADWKPAPGVRPEALEQARQALASSLKALSEAQAARANEPIVVRRSAATATKESPSGAPVWARSAKLQQSIGPFQDQRGILYWIDLLARTVSTQFAFATPSAGFGLFPIREILVPPHSTSKLNLGSGSVWFLANLLSPSFPSGNFTGFSIAGGTLESSAPMTYESGVYVIPASATVTVVATLAPLPSPVNTGIPGADAAAAVFTPPSSVKIVFKEGSASFQAIADSSAEAYGSKVTLHWAGGAPVQLTPLMELVIPCEVTPKTFSFSTVSSVLFTPSASAQIGAGGWALPLAATTINDLPEIAGPGACALALEKGASLQTPLTPAPVPILIWLLEIGTGGLYAFAEGKATSTTTTFQLWPQPAPSKLNSTVDYASNPTFFYTFLSNSVDELITTAGQVTAHVDRPVSAAGFRFPYRSSATLLLNQSQTATTLTILALGTDIKKKVFSVALENALIGVDAADAFTLTGTLTGQSVVPCIAGMYFGLRWILPTLPDPYAASFDATIVRQELGQTDGGNSGTLAAITNWDGVSNPALSFTILPPSQSKTGAGALMPTALVQPAPVKDQAAVARQPAVPYGLALLDLSTRVDLFGVAISQELERLAGGGEDNRIATQQATAPEWELAGMTLAFNGGLVATFALPQVSWEPMESSAVDQTGPIICDPASDGSPLLIAAPDRQQLVPYTPSAVLVNNIRNVSQGLSFAAAFSLPFGLNAIVRQTNRPLKGRTRSLFLAEGGQFRLNEPQFPFSIPQSPPSPTPTPIPSATELLTGAVQLTLMPPHPGKNNAMFGGQTTLETASGPAPGYGYIVVGNTSGVGTIFEGDFGPGGADPGVPIRRIDFSGYGASIFSEWIQDAAVPPAIIKVQFETTIGRTAYEVIKAESLIYPYCVRVVRTVTMQRENAGWLNRTDSGWQAATPGLFQFPPDTASAWANRIHSGALAGVFSVRNIRDQPQIPVLTVDNAKDPAKPFQFRQVLFDADLGVNTSLNIQNGGFQAPVQGVSNPPPLVVSKDMLGYVQIAPDGQSPDPNTMAELFAKTGAFTPGIACTVEAGRFGNSQPGTTLRCSAFEVNIVTEPAGNPLVPGLAAALRGAPTIPRGGGWSMGRRLYTQTAPAALPNDFPVPLVQPNTSTDYWYIADSTDVLQLNQPDNFYSLLHSTGTQKVLFESPQIPTSASISPPPPGPGLQFPKPSGAAKPGSAPQNPGSPNLGDLASILNSTGLFPDIASAISLLQGTIEQIETIPQGFQYSKSITFDPNQQASILDLSVLNVVMQYGDTTQSPTAAAQISYEVNSAASPSWTLSLGTFSLLATVPLFGSDPLLTITGKFYADEHTAPGVSNLNVQLGGALSVVKSVFSDLQALAQFLPGGVTANLDVALSNGKLTVSDTFTIGDMPLGLGHITDISLDLGMNVTLSPLSVSFTVGIGAPDNPFNWIVSPLAGNGLMQLGVDTTGPALTIQAGIGLGLSIDLGIASGSASITIAFQLSINSSTVTLMAILTGQASVDVLDGLASASLTLSAALGFSLSPPTPPVHFLPSPVVIGSETITLLASCSVGIHLQICWVVSVNWDGSWQFSQSISTPQLTIG